MHSPTRIVANSFWPLCPMLIACLFAVWRLNISWSPTPGCSPTAFAAAAPSAVPSMAPSPTLTGPVASES